MMTKRSTPVVTSYTILFALPCEPLDLVHRSWIIKRILSCWGQAKSRPDLEFDERAVDFLMPLQCITPLFEHAIVNKSKTAGCFRLCRAVFRSQYLNYAITRCLVSPCSKESLLCIYSQVYYDGRCEWNGTEICHSWFWKKWSDISLMTPAVNIHIQNFARHF